MKLLLGNKDIVTAKSLNDVLAQLDSQNLLEYTVLLRSPEDKVKKGLGVRQVVAKEFSTLALAKAIRELLSGSPYVSPDRRKDIGVAFSIFFSDIMEANIVSKEVWGKYVSQLEQFVTKEKAFDFPDDLAPTPEATKKIEDRVTEAERQEYADFLREICG